MSRVFKKLSVWYDDGPRSGAENMAVDQLLMERVGGLPLLRVYQWSEPTVSFGYFLPLTDAMGAFPGGELTYVRRWTGGGVVDHRVDVTYTLVVPRNHCLATSHGKESYGVIHSALAEALQGLGRDVRLINADTGDGAAACFANPVAYDLADASGGKIAGAGQRRTKYGLLHQGSVVADVRAKELLGALQECLADDVVRYCPEDDFLTMAKKISVDRYATDAWLHRK